MNKSEQIKLSLSKTREKRKSQICKVFELKFDYSHLSNQKIDYLNSLFLETKWLYNYILSQNNIFQFDTKISTVEVLNKDKIFVEKELKFLSSQMKQSIYERMCSSIKSLSTKKKKGKSEEVGKLKFKSQINSIPLKQFDNTYKIKNNYLKLQGFKNSFKIIGLNQIPKEAEFANAILIRKNKNFYLKITCFLPKIEKVKTNKSIGLDFGIKDSIIDSDGNKYNFQFPETKQLKKISRELNKAKKGSINRYKLKNRLNKEYEKISNKKKDVRNKFVSKLVEENDLICIQDEMIHQWHSSKMRGFGRKIQYGISGGIISDLKKKSETVLVPRKFPSTQLCPRCGLLNKHGLEERIYECICGYVEDRDIHSARNILNEGIRISMGHRNKMLLEKDSILENTCKFQAKFFNERRSSNIYI